MARYPNLKIYTLKGLAKRLSPTRPEVEKVLAQVRLNHRRMWRDNLQLSKPEENKWVRNCKGTPLAYTLSQIDKLLLAVHDKELPYFLHGGISGDFVIRIGQVIRRSTHSAAISLIDGQKRSLLQLDLKRFFEQIPKERVFSLFRSRFGCSPEVADFIAEICTVPQGQKSSVADPQQSPVLARGFATSPRIAIWCSLNFFAALHALIKKKLKGHSPKIAVYIDDIAISAVNVSKEDLLILSKEIEILAGKHFLHTHKEKVSITSQTKEHLGLLLTKHKVFVSKKIRSKTRDLLFKRKNKRITEAEKQSLKGLTVYRNHTKAVSLSRKAGLPKTSEKSLKNLDTRVV